MEMAALMVAPVADAAKVALEVVEVTVPVAGAVAVPAAVVPAEAPVAAEGVSVPDARHG